MTNVLSDVQRGALLLIIIMKYSTAPLLRHIVHLPAHSPTFPVRLRLALEAMGATYLKLGQFLAMRFDILPREVCYELNKLFEGVPPITFNEAKHVLEAELGGRLEDLFASFSASPLAAASIAQVHEAYTHEQQHVIVKIQRPGIERKFASDLRILRWVAVLIDTFGVSGTLSARQAVEEFTQYTMREMDFVVEGQTGDRLRENAQSYEVVPRVLWRLTTTRVLTEAFVDGTSLSQLSNLLSAGDNDGARAGLPHLDVDAVIHNATFSSLHQFFVRGFFHGDPHPGNIIVLQDNSVAFIDFGIFGELRDDQRIALAYWLKYLALGDIHNSFRHLSKLYTPTEDTDLQAFKHETMALLRRWLQATRDPRVSVKERHAGFYTGEMLNVLRRHHLRMSMDILLFMRAIIVLDASALRLSDRFDLVSIIRDFFQQTGPDEVGRAIISLLDLYSATTVAIGMSEMAEQVSDIMSHVSTGHGQWPLWMQEAQNTQRARHRHVVWLTAAMLTLSLLLITVALRVDVAAEGTAGALVLLVAYMVVAEVRGN